MNFKEVFENYQGLKNDIYQLEWVMAMLRNSSDEYGEFNCTVKILTEKKEELEHELEKYDRMYVYGRLDRPNQPKRSGLRPVPNYRILPK
jgi:hypothetical protein